MKRFILITVVAVTTIGFTLLITNKVKPLTKDNTALYRKFHEKKKTKRGLVY